MTRVCRDWVFGFKPFDIFCGFVVFRFFILINYTFNNFNSNRYIYIYIYIYI